MNLWRHWRNVYREAAQLCDTIERLPVDCQCGNADAHLTGRCRCGGGQVRAGSGTSGDCDELIVSLRAALSLVWEDFKRLPEWTEDTVPADLRLDVRSGVYLAAGDLDHLLRALEHLSESVAGFRSNCVVTQMKSVKRCGAALRAHCDRLDNTLQRVDCS